MTEVMFHFNVPDKRDYGCRMLRKACAQGARVAVVGAPPDLQELDRRLWALDPVEFLAHCSWPGADSHVLQASPIVLCETSQDVPHDGVLLNLGASVPAGFERFQRLIELVGCEDADREEARQRWKHYRARGYVIGRHEVASSAQR